MYPWRASSPSSRCRLSCFPGPPSLCTSSRLARALGVLTEREDEEIELATDPQLLSFQVAASLELEAPAKQALQAIRSTSARLRQLASLLGPVAADAERRAAVRQQARGNGRGGRHPEIERAT